MQRTWAWFAVFGVGPLLGCESDAPGAITGAPWFEERARASGIDFRHESGHAERYLFPEIMCTGAALFDADGDGDLDAYLVQAGSLTAAPADRPPNRLYRNLGDGRFEDAGPRTGAGDRGYGMGVATGDFDGDGDVDLYVTNVGANVLLQNDGAGRFSDVTAAAGVGDPSWSTGAAFTDYDADGDLDLFVVNYVYWSLADEVRCEDPPHGPDYCSPNSYGAPAPDTLYRNDGNGTFSDVSAESGLRTAFGNGLGVVCGDFDGDGRTDVFVANDGTENQLWVNLGGGRFADRALLAGCAVDQNGAPKAGMGVAAADVDDDGDEDLLVVNLAGESDSFYQNEGRYFSDRTPLVGLALPGRPFTRFGCGLLDFDADGHLDLFVANGRVTRGAERAGGDPYAEPDLLFRGGADGRFREVRGTREPLVATSRAAAFGDVDGDGRVDALVANRDAPPHLLINVTDGGEWIRFRALEESGGDALGATLSMRVSGRAVTRRVRSAYSYCAANDPGVHVGLGTSGEALDVQVRWVDGTVESFGDFAGGRTVDLRRGSGASGERR